MYAVIKTGSKQYKVKENDIIEIETLKLPKTKKDVSFDEVVLINDKKDITVGTPFIKGAKVVAEVLGNLRGEKITTYKYKRRKKYHRTIGHRQNLLRLRIKEISLGKE